MFRWNDALPVGLLALFGIVASVSATFDAATFDEPAHLAAGVSYLQTGDFRLNPEHPPLAKMWAALPVVAGGVERTDPGSVRWRRARQREIGFELVNGPFDDRERRAPSVHLVPARLAMVALGVLLCGVIYFWACEAWGRMGGLLALALAAVSPTLLAHTRLVTTDVPAALGFTATLWCFWRFCRAPSPGRALVTGLAIGIAWLFKYSTLLLPPLLLAATILWVLRPPPRESAAWTRGRRLAVGIGALTIVAIVGLGAIWTAYGFRYRATHAPEYSFDWPAARPPSAALARAVEFVHTRRLLPEPYIYGISYVFSKADRRTFLNGEIYEHGTRWYFPEAFLLKTTPALLVIVGWLVWRALRSPWSFDGLYLAIPIVLYGVVAILSPLNIGHRHLLPVYALLFVSSGALTVGVAPRGRAATLLIALVAAHAASSALTFPRYLSYFNALGGGPARGWHALADSNIDWGQDLGRLGAWTASHGNPLIYLAYFGSADPAVYGIRYRKIALVEDFDPGRRPVFPAPGDYFALSVTLLQGLYVADPAVAQWLERVGREMTPIARAGDSILIYRMP